MTERNYAGTSFVTQDMFGTYQYGSDLLNVTHDPSRPEQAASFAFDDDGTPAERQFLSKKVCSSVQSVGRLASPVQEWKGGDNTR